MAARRRHPRSNQASIEVLKVAIDEQRRVHDELTSAKQAVNVKTITLTGASLALLTYLYSDGSLFFPEQTYGKIFYVVGAVLTIASLGVLLYATKPLGSWMVPTSHKALKSLTERDEQKYLEYVSKAYVDCYEYNMEQYNMKHRLLNYSFYPLVFGAIILIVIKIFGGQQ